MGYDRNALPSLPRGLRLLPWENDTGKPCYLSTNDPEGSLSRLADDIESDQLCDGADVLKGAQAVLDDRKAGEHALRLALRATTQALGDVLRVADSRGARLPVRETEVEAVDGDEDEGDDPQLQSEVHG
ncbi:hypothetical protein RCO28_36230 [Streptomyces sp. LHD-70]|uniref:hypothetical protein n=1 Tax=Streptomyces sp. LHD-70 TaxID=3072140 RepID=UPI00280FDDCF|nr:hypothetical protein [Streptomyces sp. LHD-70]MDQ8707878.1 hypothetical protein [Streptomyces sp. LHD-70]